MRLYTGLTCKDQTAIHTPLIEIRGLEDDTLLQQATASITDHDILLMTSRMTVKYWYEAMQKVKAPWHGQVVAIGHTTAQALQERGAQNLIIAPQDDSYGVIELFRTDERLLHRHVIFPRSAIALPIIPDGLRELGYTVQTLTAYQNVMPENPKRVDLATIDTIVFTSPSTIDNFLKLYGTLPEDKTYETRGAITQAHLEKQLKKRNHI